MNDNVPEHEPKLNDFEIIAGTLVLATFDIADFFQFGIPGSDLIAFPLMQYWIYKKGLSGTTALIGNGLELIPGVDELPLRTIAFLITAWMDHHPSALSEKLEQAGEIEQTLEGRGRGAQGALQAEGKIANEAATVAERGAAQGAGGALEKGGVSGSGTAKETTEWSAEERRQGKKGPKRSLEGSHAEPEEGEESGDEDESAEEKEKEMSEEERQMDVILRGRYIDEVAERSMTAGGVMEGVGDQVLGAKTLKFDPNRAIEPKRAARSVPRPVAQNDNSIIDSERVDLTNNDGSENIAA